MCNPVSTYKYTRISNTSLTSDAMSVPAIQGKNVYFTGSAGCGKSTLLREIIKRSPANETFITASTGAYIVPATGLQVHVLKMVCCLGMSINRHGGAQHRRDDDPQLRRYGALERCPASRGGSH